MRTRGSSEDVIERMVGPSKPTPIPDGPTHCRCGCGRELEPLRRLGGYARECMRLVKLAGQLSVRIIGSSKAVARAVGGSTFRLLRIIKKKRNGRTEQFAVAECTCGTTRTMAIHIWRHHRPECCNKCRLRAIDTHGFEAEHG